MRPRWLALGALLACRPRAHSDRSDGRLPSLAVKRAPEGSLRVDGALDEAPWATAGRTGPLVHPGTGREEPASRVQAEARLLWDATGLYLGIRVRDPSPDRPFTNTARDPHVWERSSGVELMLQPGDPGDNRDYFELQVDTAGAVWSTRFEDYNRPISRGPDGATRYGHQDWDPAVSVASRADREGYTLELRLPWSALTGVGAQVPPRNGDAWRANVYTFRDGQRDSLAWSPLLGQGNFHRASRWGRLRFE
ncbi:MAG: carbohydrate-binding family 9-like protein [Deltaproteobacteria bacterium]|nr:carbohydrate-binding family 9-like protein [Deltaproteobacteria bacterium]